jgi:predicted ATPase
MRFGAYEIIQRLGAGGMGEVYRAKDTRLGREVAIKTLTFGHQLQGDILSRFEREARSASSLNHPNIVTIYEFGNVDGTHYIAMELLGGETLRKMLSTGPLPLARSVAIAAQVADAISRVHEIGIVHRDLKPDNVMILPDGTAKILDFGLAKFLHGDQSQTMESTGIGPFTEAGVVMGTVGYMSPEQATSCELDFRSDQFSFGSLLYEMVTGVAAFQKKTAAETIASILRDEPERLATKSLQAPAPFIWVLERCLAKDPKQRYSSTRDLARDLAAVRDRLVESPGRQSEPRPINLPVQRTAFLGRDYEAKTLSDILRRQEVRLLTLTGPGGIGKTRLALQVAQEVVEQFKGGVYFVPLSTLSQSRSVISALAQAVGACETGGQTSEESFRSFLGTQDQPTLLLLDNFEHLLSASQLVADILSIGPKIYFMVTSQAPLHIYGEHEFPVPPLQLPDLGNIPSPEVLREIPAVALFIERAKAVKPDFAFSSENALVIAAICTRLDGLPLAIELAAARVKLLSPSAMLARLESSLKLLTGGARDLPARQQTLRGTVDWSYGLLNCSEQILFRRLSVFVGGCTLEGVEAVCNAANDMELDIFDGMASMVDKSLVQRVEQPDEARFVMLSTIREYALERLLVSGEDAATRRAHAAYSLVLAEEGAGVAAGQSEWFDRFELEHDNFRAALRYLIKTGESEWGLRLGSALFRFWETREHLTEGREFIAELLKMDGAVARPKILAHLQFAAAVLAGEQGDYVSAQKLFRDNLETCRSLSDHRGVAVGLNGLGVIIRDLGDLSQSAELFEQAVAIWKSLGDPADIARALSNLANVKKLQGDYALASSLYDECLTMFRKAADVGGVAWTLNYRGDAAREQGDFNAARSFYEQSLEAFSLLRDGWGMAGVLSDLAGLTRDEGKFPEARRLFAESGKLFRSLGHKRGIARVLEGLAISEALQSNAERSLRAAGAAAALRQRLGAPLNAAEQARLDKALETSRKTLSNSAGMSAWMEGWRIPVEEAFQEALGPEAP